MEALIARRQLILDNIRDNDESGFNYRKVPSHTNNISLFTGDVRIHLIKSSDCLIGD